MEPLPGAYIDLKQVDFMWEDGYSKVGAVNLLAGYTIGATTIAVDGFTGLLKAGVMLKFANHATEYEITSVTGTPNTTGIVFSPALTAAVADNVVVNVGPARLYIKVGEGNLTFSEKVNREYKMDRGLLDQVRNGDEVPMDVNFQFAYIYLKSPAGSITPTPREFMYQEGPSSDNVSTGKDCEPYAINIVLLNNANATTCAGITTPKEKTTLKEFRQESFDFDVKAGTVAAVGKCNVPRAIVERL